MPKLIDFKLLATECVTDLDSRREMIFLKSFWPLLKQALLFEAAGAVVEISLSLQSSNHNQVKFAQIRETHWRNLLKIFLVLHEYQAYRSNIAIIF